MRDSFPVIRAEIGTDGSCVRMLIVLAEAEDDSSAEAEIVLAVVESVRDSCQEIFGLHGANREVFGDLEVNSAAGGHCKMALPADLLDAGARQYASEKHLNERCNHTMPEA